MNPTYCYLELTNACNSKCITCARSVMSRNVGFMNHLTFEKSVSGINDLGVQIVELEIVGEVLLHPDLMYMISNLGVEEIIITTNCIALTRDVTDRLLDTPLTKIYLSIHTIRKDIFKEFHRVRMKDDYLENIDYFLEQRKIRRPDLKVEIASLPIPITEPYINEIYERYNGFDFNRNIETLNNQGGLMDNVEIGDGDPICSFPFNTVGILYNGDVVSCHLDIDAHYIMGNVNESSLRDIWTGDRFNDFRENLMKNHAYGNCGKCSIRHNPKFGAG